MRGKILGVKRGRFWRDGDKLGIVASVGVDGTTVTQVAQRHEVTRQQIYAWRHDLKKNGLCHAKACGDRDAILRTNIDCHRSG